MKRFFTVFLAISIFIPAFAQTASKVIKEPVSKVLVKSSKKLNSQFRIGGTPRSVVAILLPANTVEWHYSFSTRKDGTAEKNLELGIQIAGIVASVYTGGATGVVFSGISKTAAGSISTPNGSVAINSYLMDPADATKFINGDRFSHYTIGSMTNTTHGERQIPYMGQNTFYVGFENTDNMDAVYVDFEIVAVGIEDKVVTEQVEQGQEPTYNKTNSIYSKSEFIGKWKDENSTFEFFNDGNVYLRWDNGKSVSGRWGLINNILYFDFSGIESNIYKRKDYYDILYCNGKILRYQSTVMGVKGAIYNAKKISP